MPLASYICQVLNGCRLFAPNNNAGVLYGHDDHAPPRLLNPSLPIPPLNVQPGANAGNGAIRVGAGIDGQPTWFVWASGGYVIWAGPNNVQVVTGLLANEPRTFRVLLMGQAPVFSIA